MKYYDDQSRGEGLPGSERLMDSASFYRKLDARARNALRDTMKVAYEVVSKGGFIVFVGSHSRSRHHATVAAVESCQAFLGKWTPGVIEDWPAHVARKDDVEKLLADDNTDRKAPAVRRLRQERHRLRKVFVGAASVSQRPDMLFAFDLSGDLNAVNEARNLGIPVAAVVKDAEQAASVTYALPDEADLQNFYAHMVARAAREGMTRFVGPFTGPMSRRQRYSPPPRHIHDLFAEDVFVSGAVGSAELFTDAGGSDEPLPEIRHSSINELGIEPIPFEDDDEAGFVPSESLVGMVHRGLFGHARRLGAVPKGADDLDGVLRKRARIITGPRILETIAWRARRTIAGLLPLRPLIVNDEFDDDFVVILSESLPFRRDMPFYQQLKQELTAFLAGGGSIAGNWGHLKVEDGAVEFVLAARIARPETTWEKPSRIEFN